MGSRRSGERWEKRQANKYRDKPRDHFDDVAEGGYQRKKQARQSLKRPLPNDLDMLSVVLGEVKFPKEPLNQKSKIRPFYIGGRYYDENNALQAVDCFRGSASSSRQSFNTLPLSEQLNASVGGQRSAEISLTDNYYFLNQSKRFMQWKKDKLPIELLPDLILRRVDKLMQNCDVIGEDVGLFKKNRGWVRHGLVFNSIKTEDVNRNRFVPEAVDAPFEQVPFEIPGVLEQRDIDNIVAIAKNYGDFCTKNRLPVIWPELGTWGYWPEEFMVFIEPQESGVKLPWLDHSFNNKTGFRVDKTTKSTFIPNPGSNHYPPQNHPASP